MLLLYRPTVIVGLFIQQAVALFVLKSRVGFSIFKWIATLTSDFLSQSGAGAEFFFDAETVAKHWFFVSTVRYVYSMSQISTVYTCHECASSRPSFFSLLLYRCCIMYVKFVLFLQS